MSTGQRARLRMALALLAVTARALPRSIRARYAAEWRADVAFAPETALPYASSLLWQVGTLRRAVTGSRPVRCRIHWHDDVTVHDNPENRHFSSHVCQGCGRVKDDWKGPAPAADTWAWTASSGQLH